MSVCVFPRGGHPLLLPQLALLRFERCGGVGFYILFILFLLLYFLFFFIFAIQLIIIAFTGLSMVCVGDRQ